VAVKSTGTGEMCS